MANVTTVDFATHEPPLPPSYRRIRLASALLAWIFTGLLIADGLFVAFLTAAFLVPFTGDHLGIGPAGMFITAGKELPGAYASVATVPLMQRLAHIPVGLINLAPPLFIFWSLRRLFSLYARGIVFAAENARCIKWIGGWLAVNAVAPLLGVCFLRILHLVIDQTWMHAYSLQELILGGVVYVIALVMQVGHEIEQDQRQFV